MSTLNDQLQTSTLPIGGAVAAGRIGGLGTITTTSITTGTRWGLVRV